MDNVGESQQKVRQLRLTEAPATTADLDARTVRLLGVLSN